MSVVSRDDVISLISDLVRIESVTPWLVEGGPVSATSLTTSLPTWPIFRRSRSDRDCARSI